MLFQLCLPWLLTVTSLVQASPTRTLQAPGPSETDPSPDDITCSDYETCSSKGRGYWRELQAVLAQAQPVDRTDGKAIFDRDYGCEFMTSGETSAGLRAIPQDLEQHGFDWAWTEGFGVFSKDPETGEDNPDTAYSNLFETSKGLVVAVENFRDLDERKSLQWSEIIYQAWQIAQEYDDNKKEWNIPPGHPGGGPISTLQTIVQLDVQNRETLAVLRTIWKAQKLEWNIIDRTWYKFTEADTPYWFYALLGTVNVKGTLYLLKDHAAEIGKKTITEIWVRWALVDPDIWINVAKAEGYSTA
ncbi:MAG: hypothetical protein LQ338_000883 [Usnochroma carphineum]|nr:MAG: hypothetical protein LQ338_000883 [Usnochroma carphineum]